MLDRIVTGGYVTDESGVPRPIQRSFISANAVGNTAAVAAQGAGVKIRVLSAYYVTTLANSVKFQSAAADITPPTPLAANGGMVLPFNAIGWFDTAANAALNVNCSVATVTGVMVIWVQAS